MRSPRRFEQGFTLIELAIVLGIFAVVVAGIWMVVGVTFENTRQYQANREVQSMVQNIRQLEQRITRFTSSTGTDITATLDSQTAFPIEMRANSGNATGNLNHPWSTRGDSVHVTVTDVAEFGVEFKNMPKKACNQIATKLSGGEIAGLNALVINGTVTLAKDLPLTIIGAAALCTKTNDNSVQWKFALRG